MCFANLDRTLNDLARQAQCAPVGSPERRKLLDRLVRRLIHPNCLKYPSRQLQISAGFYQYLCREALSRTLAETCSHIDRYDPNKDVRAWFNFILRKRFLDVLRSHRKQGVTQLPRDRPSSPAASGVSVHPDLKNIEQYCETLVRNERRDIDKLVEFIRQDPERRLQLSLACAPQITFEAIALQRLQQEKTWQQIADELELPPHRIYRFFHNTFRKNLPYFQTYLREIS